MTKDGTFNRLAMGLSLDERKNLLEKLSNQSNIPKDPLYDDNDDAPSEGVEAQYAKLPWYYHVWFFILSFFKAKPPLKIFEDQRIAVLGREIDTLAPGCYDYQRNLLLSLCFTALTDLKEGAHFFYNALDISVNRDKGAFYAFLGSLEMGEIHHRLQSETSPVFIAENNPEASEAELRQMAFHTMEEAIGTISEDQRNVMYANARSLYCLKELASFLFDRVIMAFAYNSAVSSQACSANVVKDMLERLNNILFSIKNPPSISLLESLFIFILQERLGEPDFDINREIRALLSKAENALVSLREFNKQIPLTLILRCANRNLTLSPKIISGGEDWFVVYREYWKRHVESQFAEYMQDRRHRELLNAFRYFLKGTNLKALGNVASDTNPQGLPIKGSFSLSFLLTFYSVVFMNDINKILRPILIDGEFYKRENRTEFTESYNSLIKLETDIKKFEAVISPSGDYGKRYIQARGDMTSLIAKRRKIQMVLEDATDAATKIIDEARTAIERMINILNGIIKKDISGKYDTLSNLADFAGRGAVALTAYTGSVIDTIQKLKKTLQLLDDIEVMETGR
jgi:hypothetical protein